MAAPICSAASPSSAGERGDFPAIAADLLRVRRHLAHAALERLVEHPPTAAAIRAVARAIEAMAAAGTDPGALARADLDVLAAVLDATRSPVLRLCLNPVTAVVGSNAALRAALYVAPATNLAGWRLLVAWMAKPRAAELGTFLAVLAERDAATLARLARRPRTPRSPR